MKHLSISVVNRLAKLRDEGKISECLEQALELLPASNEHLSEPRVLLKSLIADCHFDLKQYEEALHIYDQIVAEKPYSIAFANRGYAKWGLGRLDEASKDYRVALKLDPTDAINTRNAADIACKMGELNRALLLARRASRLAPQDPVPYIVAAIVHNRRGKTVEARGLLRKALELDPSNKRALKGLDQLHCDSK